LSPLVPRYYSACSAALAHPGQVYFAFNIVDNVFQNSSHTPYVGLVVTDFYLSLLPCPRAPGLCTSWLEQRCKQLAKTEGKELGCDWIWFDEASKASSHTNDVTSIDCRLDLLRHSQASGSSMLPLYRRPAKDFHPPESLQTPMILIGPGTGVAPFIGFLEHR